MEDVTEVHLRLAHLDEPPLCAELQNDGRFCLSVNPSTVDWYAACFFLKLCLKVEFPIFDGRAFANETLERCGDEVCADGGKEGRAASLQGLQPIPDSEGLAHHVDYNG
jgi:hypothetical protein